MNKDMDKLRKCIIDMQKKNKRAFSPILKHTQELIDLAEKFSSLVNFSKKIELWGSNNIYVPFLDEDSPFKNENTDLKEIFELIDEFYNLGKVIDDKMKKIGLTWEE